MQHFVSSESTACPLPPVPQERHENSWQAAEDNAPATHTIAAVGVEERRAMQARIRRLGRRSVLTPDALAQLGNAHLPTQTLHALLTMLEGPFEERWEERTVAAWALGQARLSPRQRETVSHTLCRVLRRRPLVGRVRGSQNIDPLAVSLFACLAFWMGVNSLFHPAYSKVTVGPLGLMAGTLAGGLLAAHMAQRSLKAAIRMRDNRLRATTVTALGRIGSVSSLPVLVRAALDANGKVRRAAEIALQAGIARLTDAEAGQMEADVVPNLCRLLERARELLSRDTERAEALALNALDALTKVGDGQAAQTVRGMINTGWTAPVNHAAKRLLPLLLERRRHETDQRVLLRGAAMPSDAPDLLLRPTGLHSREEAPERLLRSSHQPS